MLGRNLEGLVTRAQEQKAQWKDSHVSVEHLVLAFLDDSRFGSNLFKAASLTQQNLNDAIKAVRGFNRVTDQVCVGRSFSSFLEAGSCGAHTLTCGNAP